MRYLMFDPRKNKYFKGYESYPKEDEADYVSTKIGYCDAMAEAQYFLSEREALYYLYGEYGMDYTESTFCVIGVPEKLYLNIVTRYYTERERYA